MVSFILAHHIGISILSVFSSVFAILLLGVTLFLWRKVSRLEKTLKRFCSGANGAQLEDVIKHTQDKLTALDTDIQELFEISNKIHALANRSIHKVAMVRFNPFKDLGGNQSFSLALLDGKNDGIIISSLHTREGTRVYSKAITKGKSSEHELTDEEQSILAQAKAKNIIVAPHTK